VIERFRDDQGRGTQGHDLYSAAFSPDGKRIVTGSEDSSIAIWDVASGGLVGRLEGHQGQVMTVTFAPNGDYLVTKRCGEPSIRSRRGRLGHEAHLPVGEVAGPELVEATGRDPRLPTGLDHAHLLAEDAVQQLLAEPCETRCRSHGHLLPVELPLSGWSMLVALLRVWGVTGVSGSYVGSKA